MLQGCNFGIFNFLFIRTSTKKPCAASRCSNVEHFTSYSSKTEIFLFHPCNSFASHYSCSPTYQKFSSATNLGEKFNSNLPLFYQRINEMCSHVTCILDLFTHLEQIQSQPKQASLPYTFIIHYPGQTNASAFFSTCPKMMWNQANLSLHHTSLSPVATCPDLKILLIT